jgi:translocator protein
MTNNPMDWYDQLAKPAWTPSGDTISLIWRILYPIIAVTFLFVFVQAGRRKIPPAVAVPFAINLVANLLFTPLMFQLQNLFLASIDILIVLATIPWMMIAVWPYYRWVALAQLPYLIWVAIATVLQLSITAMNW